MADDPKIRYFFIVQINIQPTAAARATRVKGFIVLVSSMFSPRQSCPAQESNRKRESHSEAATRLHLFYCYRRIVMRAQPTEGPSWGYPVLVLGAVSFFLEPFCGKSLSKIDKSDVN